jgi:hypothetical protein
VSILCAGQEFVKIIEKLVNPVAKVRRLKGTRLNSFCENYASKKDALGASCGSSKEVNEMLAVDICQYLVVHRKEHLRRLIAMTICETALLLLLIGEMIFLDWCFNGAFQNYSTLNFEDQYGAIFPIWGNVLRDYVCFFARSTVYKTTCIEPCDSRCQQIFNPMYSFLAHCAYLTHGTGLKIENNEYLCKLSSNRANRYVSAALLMLSNRANDNRSYGLQAVIY